MSAIGPTGLPVEASISAVAAALDNPGSAVLVAPTGSGKTTIVPLRLLAEPWADGRRIVVLEPRRIATRAAARRMADLMGEPVGQTVGYSTRDDRKVSRSTLVEVVTEGVLTRRLQHDPDLPGTALLVFDEIHERNLQTDLGLALALDARRLVRPDLRILAMSATVDAEGIAAVIGGDEPAPIITSDARRHPIEITWAAPPRRARIEDHAAATIRRALAEHEGSVLVFLPGMGEIKRTERAIGDQEPGVTVHILHGSLSAGHQDAAIAPAAPGTRKVVLSTDIAESSLTVDGVSIVVDSGIARKPRLDVRTGMTRLHTVPISRASADQRSGRAGRLGPGVAYRMWAKMEHGTRARQTPPEIQQVDLAGLMLELAAWGTTDPGSLQFIDPPPERGVTEAVELLGVLGALDPDGRITPRGVDMARLPAHPRLVRMIVDADRDG
ncbi:ATP-dependent RNA helicase, partial [bacterium]|nr:ATP-dependent RNA helicase [bacterium]